MAYWGYVKSIKNFIKNINEHRVPSVLEIGVDKGQTFVPLLSYLTNNCEKFTLYGIDIKIQSSLQVMLELMTEDLAGEDEIHDLKMFRRSSLEILPELFEHMKNHGESGLFDVILIDGDHNYYTVEKEIRYCASLLRNGGVIVVDDYSGNGENENEYFSEISGYENNELATKREETEIEGKVGVRQAIDDFLKENDEWAITDALAPGFEPRLLYRRGEQTFYESHTGKAVNLEKDSLTLSHHDKGIFVE